MPVNFSKKYKCSKCGKILHKGDSVFICIECHHPVCEECWREGQQLCPLCDGVLEPNVIK